RSVKNKSGIEEERRLLYVAITRASKKIKISYCQNRFQFGTIQSTEKSLFLDELKDCTNFIYKNEYQEQRTEGNSYTQKRSFYRQKTSISVPSSLKKVKYTNYKDNRGLIKGMKINHNIFGKGLILSVDENHGNEKIKVIFDNFGKKILLTKFAKFEIIK
ncbi:MAG: 3'-5' exonuclease, partial [Bacteroidota bacterium]|nr:3'-5' exonuclease [Bacteroidota bacterium]